MKIQFRQKVYKNGKLVANEWSSPVEVETPLEAAQAAVDLITPSIDGGYDEKIHVHLVEVRTPSEVGDNF